MVGHSLVSCAEAVNNSTKVPIPTEYSNSPRMDGRALSSLGVQERAGTLPTARANQSSFPRFDVEHSLDPLATASQHQLSLHDLASGGPQLELDVSDRSPYSTSPRSSGLTNHDAGHHKRVRIRQLHPHRTSLRSISYCLGLIERTVNNSDPASSL